MQSPYNSRCFTVTRGSFRKYYNTKLSVLLKDKRLNGGLTLNSAEINAEKVILTCLVLI